jgi:hypothetical protein
MVIAKLIKFCAGFVLYDSVAAKINSYLLSNNGMASWGGTLLVAHPRFLCPYVDVIQLSNAETTQFDISKYDIYYDKFEPRLLYPSITKKFILPMLNTAPILIHNIEHNAKANRMYLSGKFIIVD